MKNIFKHFMFGAVSLLAAQMVFAGQQTPSACPSAQDIAKVGVTRAVNYNQEWWAVFELKNSYNTNRDWTFFVERLNFPNASNDAVLAKINAALPGMVLTDSARDDDGSGTTWYCVYEHETNPDIIGIAVTPVLVVADLNGSLGKRFNKQH